MIIACSTESTSFLSPWACRYACARQRHRKGLEVFALFVVGARPLRLTTAGWAGAPSKVVKRLPQPGTCGGDGSRTPPRGARIDHLGIPDSGRKGTFASGDPCVGEAVPNRIARQTLPNSGTSVRKVLAPQAHGKSQTQNRKLPNHLRVAVRFHAFSGRSEVSLCCPHPASP